MESGRRAQLRDLPSVDKVLNSDAAAELLAMLLETRQVQWTGQFIFALFWLAVVLSIGSFLMPLDSPSVRVRYRCVGGVVSVLRVSNGPARRDRRAAVRVSWAWFWHLIDPACDEDDAEAVDILRLIGGGCAKPGRGA